MADNFRQEYLYLIGEASGKHIKSWKLNDKKVTQLFCPRDKCEQRILEELSAAQDSIIFLTFSFTSYPIRDVLIDKHRQGLCISGVVESRGATASYASYPVLREHNISVFRAQTPGVMHHKAFLIDNHTAIVGSYNPSANANTNNAETVIIIREEAIRNTVYNEYTRLTGYLPCKRF
jgi:phosphatidylserine/phosphatidylglycerophosphate/cardiolipin synthase-like enzyme